MSKRERLVLSILFVNITQLKERRVSTYAIKLDGMKFHLKWGLYFWDRSKKEKNN